MSNKERIEYLLQRYSEEKATQDELEELSSRLNNPLEEQLANEWLYNQLQQQQSISATDFDKNRLESILRQIHQQDVTTKKTYRLKRWWPAAAAALILAFAALYKFIPNHSSSSSNPENIVQSVIMPGHTGAVLHLSNGHKILLDSLQNGALTTQGNIKVIKKNGALEYIGNSDKLIYNTITTNRGRQWALTLADGTKVWLNAESSIRYPLSFNGKERIVEITGEAYFEVVHNKKHPFKVRVKNQVVEDLGTTFNINAYKADVTTTLLSGSLRVNLADRSALLKPGQQAQVGEFIHLKYGVNTEAITAWKNGLFQFDRANLQTIMEQISRWYNVSVVYNGQPSIREFSGKIPRNTPLSDVLMILKQLGVHFEVEGEKVGSGLAGKIVVSP